VTHPDAEDVLELWFGQLDEDGRADDAHRQRWFRKDPDFDALLRERFGALHEAVAAGERPAWRETPRGRLATIVVLDQLSRNLHRDTARMFENDAEALAVAEAALAAGDDDALATHERYFLYMPFMHAEDLEAQERCVRLFEAARDAAPPKLASTFDPTWAVRHRDIVARFGRFPHRNALLGRASTPEEEAFLKEPGSSF